MADAVTKLPVTNDETKSGRPPAIAGWHPLESLHREVDRLFHDFNGGAWRHPFRRNAFDMEPFWRRELSWVTAPSVDLIEKKNSYEITAELPGIDEKDVDVLLSNNVLTIRGEKKEEHKEEKKDYYCSERRYGAFERSFRVPEHVDMDKIEASFKKGVLSVTLPKTADAQKTEKKIAIKAGSG